MFQQINLNPDKKRVGDCTVRAIAAATGQDWESVYLGLCLEGYRQHDMPSANAVWGGYLRRNGWMRYALPNTCPDCYTAAQFCADHPHGVFVLAAATHVICAKDGDWLDTWDSGDETVLYYWERG